jgi:redox-sensitive bicupin YhaK (pirin superfamily)
MSIERIIGKRNHDLGGGFEVGRVLPFHARRMVGPFIFFDHLGPLELAPGIPRELDVRPHPHIGLCTVTYLYNGEITHRDSLGVHQDIRPGEVNWMVAGSGITHSERLEYARAHGAIMHGIQAWVALPTEDEETDSAFYHRDGADLPQWREDGVQGRLIAGENGGSRQWVGGRHCRAIIIDGHGAGRRAARQRFLLWNFVSSSQERLEQAAADWRQQRMNLPVGDDLEFIPMPENGR